jgi:hypothetical protein
MHLENPKRERCRKRVEERARDRYEWGMWKGSELSLFGLLSFQSFQRTNERKPPRGRNNETLKTLNTSLRERCTQKI